MNPTRRVERAEVETALRDLLGEGEQAARQYAGMSISLAGAVSLLALAFAFRRNPRGLDDPSMLSELAVGLCIVPIVSPLAWKAHFVTLLAGYWLIWRVMQRTQVRRRWVWALWWGSFACLTLSAPALISTAGRSVAESLNVITAGALIVVGLTIWAARQLPLQPPASGAAPTPP